MTTSFFSYSVFYDNDMGLDDVNEEVEGNKNIALGFWNTI